MWGMSQDLSYTSAEIEALKAAAAEHGLDPASVFRLSGDPVISLEALEKRHGLVKKQN
jgi:hypothetical protein